MALAFATVGVAQRPPAATIQLNLDIGPISTVTFSPTGEYLIVGGDDRSTRLLRTSDGIEIRRVPGEGALVSSDERAMLTTIRSADDGDFFPSNRIVQLFDFVTGSPLAKVGRANQATFAAFSADGSSFATVEVPTSEQSWSPVGAKEVQLWNVGEHRASERFDVSPSEAISVAVSGDGRSIVAGTVDDPPVVWIRDGVATRRIRLEASGAGDPRRPLLAPTDEVAFVPEQPVVVSIGYEWAPSGQSEGRIAWRRHVGDSRVLRRWSLQTGRQLGIEHGRKIVLSQDRRRAAVSASERLAWVSDLVTGSVVRIFDVTGPNLVLSSDGEWFSDGHHWWNVSSGERRRPTARLSDETVRALSPDGRLAVTVRPAGLRVLHTGDGSPLYEVPTTRTGAAGQESALLVHTTALSADGRKLLMGTDTGAAASWDLSIGQPDTRLELNVGPIVTAAWSPDGERVAFGTDRSIHLWSASDPRELWQHPRTEQRLPLVRFDASGSAVTAETSGWNIRTFDGDKGHVLDELPWSKLHDWRTTRIIESPDRRWRLRMGVDDRAGSFDTKIEPLFAGNEYERSVDYRSAGAWAPDSQHVALGDRFGTVEIHPLPNAEHPDRVARLTGHTALITSIVYTRDNRWLITSSADRTTRVWNQETHQLAATLVVTTTGWMVVTPDGRFDTNLLDRMPPLHWTMGDDPLRPLPLELFTRQYFTPRLLPRVMAGSPEGPVPDLGDLNRAQPEVEIVTVARHAENPAHAEVTVRVKETTYRGRASGVHDLRLFRDGQLTAYHAGPVTLDANRSATMRFDAVKLPVVQESAIEFTAYAFNSDRVKSATARQTLAATASDPAATLAARRAFVLAIGVNETPRAPRLRLRFAANDARSIADVVGRSLRATNQFTEVQVSLLVAERTTSASATKARVEAALRALATTVRPDDFVLVAFSGHGLTDRDGAFHLVPSDAVDTGATLPGGTISTMELTDWFRPIDGREIVLLLDTCHSSASVGGNDFRPGPMGDAGLGQLAYDKGMRVLAASQAADVAFEHERLQKGLLSYALIDEGLVQGLADRQPSDGAVRLVEWLAYGVRQVPVLHDRLRVLRASRGLTRVPGRSAAQTPTLFDFGRRTGDTLSIASVDSVPKARLR